MKILQTALLGFALPACAEGEWVPPTEGAPSLPSGSTPVDCEEYFQEIPVSGAAVLEPMVLGTSYDVSSTGTSFERTFAASPTPEEGLVLFFFEIPCPGTLQLSAIVSDPIPGDGYEDPDSIYVQIDTEEEYLVEYGCQTEEWRGKWGKAHLSPGCSRVKTVNLNVYEEGSHAVILRSAESYVGGLWSATESLILGFYPVR